MASLSSRPSVGRKPVGQVLQQQGPQPQGVASVSYVQAGYQQQQQQQQMQGQMQMQQPVYMQGQQQHVQQQASYQQSAPQHPQIYQQQHQQHQHQQQQRPIQGQSFPQQPVQQQHAQQRTVQQWSGQSQKQQPAVYHQQVAQPQAPQQQNVYQQARQQPVQQSVQQPVQQRPVQQSQQPVQQQPLQQHFGQPQSVQQPQQRLQQGPVQQQSLQQQPLQQQPLGQQPFQQQPLQQQPLGQQPFQQQPLQQVQQQPLQQQPLQQQPLQQVQQQPLQQQPLQQQMTGQRLPTPNTASHAINRHSISSAASVRSMGSVTSSHTNPSQTLGSPTSYPASISHQGGPSFITCTLCSTDITNDSSHLECLACTAAQVPTFFCENCCVSKGAVSNHHHHMSNLVSPSDVVTFGPEVSAHGWDVRRSAIGMTWYHHKGSKIKTFEKPKPPIPIAQPQIFPGDSILDDGWEEIKDPDGRLFYYHRATKVSKWTRPPRNQLPPGWVECTNPDGRTYYLNNVTQATTWDRPSGSSRMTNNDQKSITSTTGPILETTGWSPTDKRHSLSSQGQNTTTPQSPTSVRSSTILETSEWSPEVETSTVSAFRTASVPNTFIETTNWAPSDTTHRPIPTRADTTPLPEAYRHQQYGNTQHNRTFSNIPSGSAAAKKGIVKSTKTAAHATAKGVKVAGKKLKNSKNAQRIVAGVGMAAVNAVLVNQFGFSIPVGVGTAAVGLVNSIDFDKDTTVADGTDTGVTADGVLENSVDTSGYAGQSSILENTGDTSQPSIPDSVGNVTSVNAPNNMAGNDYIVGGGSEVVQTTVVQEEVVFIPGGPVPMMQQPMVQQPQQIRSINTYGGPQHINTGAPQTTGSGPAPGTSEWEFESIKQRPASMIGSHIPVHVPKSANQSTAPAAGFQSQRPIQHQGPGLAGHGSLPQSHIPVHSHRPPNTMPTQNQPQPQQQIPTQFHNPGLSQASHQPGWAGQPQIAPQYQGQNQPYLPNQPQARPQANQAHMPSQQQGLQPQGSNQTQFHQQANKPQAQWSQSQNSGPQQPQSQYPNKPPGVAPTQTPSKPLLKPQQKKALMNAGVKIGTSLLKHAIRSSLSGNSGGDDYDDDDNDNSFDFGDMSNDGGNDFDSSNNFDNDTADYDPQDQVQNQLVDQDQQFDGGFGGGTDPGTTSDVNDFGGNDQLGGTDCFADSGAGYTYDNQNQLGTDTSGNDIDLSAQAGFSSPTDTAFNQQQAIDTQAQGILQPSMNDDNAAMDGFFTTPDFTTQSPSILQPSMEDDNAAMNGFYTTPDVTTQAPGIFQTSMADDDAAMNGFSTSSDGFNVQNNGGYDVDTSQSIDPSFSQNTILDPSVSYDSSSVVSDNLWTVSLPQTSGLQSSTASQAYAGLTSASLSGPMFDYYDSFAAFGGEIPLDDESDEDLPQDLSTEIDTSNEDQTDGLLQDPTLTSADLDSAGLSSQDVDAPSSPGLNLGVDQQSLGQSQDMDNQSVMQGDDIGSITPTNTNMGASSIPQVQTTAISQLYDGSGYGGPDSAGNSPVDTQATTPTGTGSGAGMSGMLSNPPLTPPMMPVTTLTPDPMPDLALLSVGQ